MKKVIITGANGFIGSNLIKRLLVLNVQIVAIDVFFSDDRVPINPLVTRIVSTLDDEESLMSVIPDGEYDAFYHLAWCGVNGKEKTNPMIQIDNCKIALVCAVVAKKFNCKKFLCSGTIAEQAIHSLPYLENTSGAMMYGAAKHCTHLMLETYCKNIGLQFVWMQFSNIFGPDNKTGNLISYVLEELLNNREAKFGPATQPYDFIYIDDLIDAVLKLGCCNTKKNIYFIGSGTPRQLKDYLIEIGEVLKKDELIRIGAREDDGIRYTMDMFDARDLKKEIGEYISKDFSEAIRYTINNY